MLYVTNITNNIKYPHATQVMLSLVPYLQTDLNVHLYSYLWLFHQIIRSLKVGLYKPDNTVYVGRAEAFKACGVGKLVGNETLET